MKRNNMSQHGATLQTYNQELVKCLEDLRTKRKDLLQVVQQEEQEKATIEKNIETLQDKLSGVCDNLEKHKTLCESYDRTIRDTEAGFKKVFGY
ncbi:microtubule nucleation factor SSNA1-like isoform X3 [Zophobas morio]|uniref:microtubule nucleation factor SSNA1-like isoform X3 n=1 Tax=Zophobas morio TaxID=2755281 RepID=UPI003082DC46